MPAFLALLLGTLVLDQATKSMVRAWMPLGSEIPLLPFLSFTHVENTGIAFGMFQGRNMIFIVLGIVLTAFLIAYAVRLLRSDRVTALAMAAIIGGAIGNLVDRFWFGRVTDFVDVYAGRYHWPVFNVADSAICVGAAIVVLHGLIDWRRAERR